MNHAIGVAHCGWVGTGNRMAEKNFWQEMMRTFGTDPADVTAAIGPSIGKCCFQMDEPVLALFRKNYSLHSLSPAMSVLLKISNQIVHFRMQLFPVKLRQIKCKILITAPQAESLRISTHQK